MASQAHWKDDHSIHDPHQQHLCVLQSGMELRVLHAVAYQQTWYGKWGYKFGRGPFNISKKTWVSTLKLLHCIPMAAILEDFESCIADSTVPDIIQRYQVCDLCYLRFASGGICVWATCSKIVL